MVVGSEVLEVRRRSVPLVRSLAVRAVVAWCDTLVCMRQAELIGKGKGHPRTGHEGPEEE
jgi:hypothetical protein